MTGLPELLLHDQIVELLTACPTLPFGDEGEQVPTYRAIRLPQDPVTQ